MIINDEIDANSYTTKSLRIWCKQASKFATVASKLFELVANSSEQTANQNTNIAAEVCKVARKRTSGLTVRPVTWARSSHVAWSKHVIEITANDILVTFYSHSGSFFFVYLWQYARQPGRFR